MIVDQETYRLLNEGLALYHAGDTFEAHELWEEAWKDEVGRSKRTLQVLIQISAGLYKHSIGNPVGTCKLLAKAKDNLEEIRVGCSAWLGIDLVKLDQDLATALAAADEIARGNEATVSPPPLPARSGSDGILYLHGFASSPGSNKAMHIVPALRERGFHVDVPDLNEDDFEHLTVSRALALAKRHVRERTIIIGSSFGGYIASLLAAVDDRVRGLVLMAPAFDFADRLENLYGADAMAQWKKDGSTLVDHYAYGDRRPIGYGMLVDAKKHVGRPTLRVPTYILQGKRDDVVPEAMVREVAAAAAGPVELDVVDDEHGLVDSASRALEAAFSMIESAGLEPEPPLTS